MPVNNNLKPVELPMDVKFGKAPKTNFKNNLNSIKVTMIDYPSITELLTYIPSFVDATWAEDPEKLYNGDEAIGLLTDMFEGRTLPGARETMKFTFRIQGISLQEVTHILRHRMATFSADCSGDKWWTDKDALVPYSIENSPEFYERYRDVVEASKKLYCDMIDSKDISIMDARYILPRCLETYYYMSIDYNNLLAFIKQREDVQIQPETDNVLAYQMFHCLLAVYGKLVANAVDFSNPSTFYQKMARTGKATNLYFPEPYIDNFEYNENDFIYQKRRCELNGTLGGYYNEFNRIQGEYFTEFKKYGVKVPNFIEVDYEHADY